MSVRRYNGKAGLCWHVVVELGKDAAGRRKQHVIKRDPDTDLPMNRKRAEQIDREKKIVQFRGGIVLPDATPLADYLHHWLTETAGDRAESTSYNWASIVRTRIAPDPLGTTPLGHVTTYQLHQFFRGQMTRYAPTSVQVTRTVLNAGLGQAVAWKLIDANPLAGMRLNLGQAEERIVWTADDCGRFLIAVADTPWGVLWRLLLDSWMRIGEALALTWDDLDRAASEVRVNKTIAVTGGGKHAPVPRTKSAKGRRVIALTPETMRALRQHWRAQAARKLALGPYWTDRNLIFERGDGEMVHATVCRDHLALAVAICGLPADSTPHTLRHTGATLAVAAGMPLHAVKERLGHANIAMTANLYAHASRDADRRLAEEMGRILGGV